MCQIKRACYALCTTTKPLALAASQAQDYEKKIRNLTKKLRQIIGLKVFAPCPHEIFSYVLLFFLAISARGQARDLVIAEHFRPCSFATVKVTGASV